MRIVIDSNVWISALVFGGRPSAILKKTVHEGWTIVISEEILTEVRRTLHKKFTNFIDDFEDLYAAMQPRVVIVKLGGLKVSICRDDDDNRVIETALIGDVSHIISGDKDLLAIGIHQDITMISPADFMQKY